jgi:transcriptional regulator with XRE-family HTH domain
VATRERAVDRGNALGHRVVTELGREIRVARTDRGLSLRAVALAVGLSATHVSRIERGRSPEVPVLVLARLLSVVGLELSCRAYPTGHPVRDAAHVALLDRFRRLLHRSLTFVTEVPLPRAGDLRAWDGLVRGPGWMMAVEAETRPRDRQALDRRIALKLRDGGLDAVVLVLADTRANRALLRTDGAAWTTRYPILGRRAVELLGAGVHPGGSAIVLL